MQLSRFVLIYREVRPGEHVLYSVLSDRYMGIDGATLEAIERWSNGSLPDGSVEKETQAALLEEGFLFEDRAADDAQLRDHLDRASDGVPGEMQLTLMPTLACDLACGYGFQKDHPAFETMHAHTEAATAQWILRAVGEQYLRASRLPSK